MHWLHVDPNSDFSTFRHFFSKFLACLEEFWLFLPAAKRLGLTLLGVLPLATFRSRLTFSHFNFVISFEKGACLSRLAGGPGVIVINTNLKSNADKKLYWNRGFIALQFPFMY